jgi:AbrB family looped-hinge helix DNA binding protein
MVESEPGESYTQSEPGIASEGPAYHCLTRVLPANPNMDTTRLSSKGQVVLPNSIRSARNWKPGIELAVENRPEGVLLRPLKPFAETELAQVVGSAGYSGPRKSLKDMDEAVLREARKRR